MWIIAGPREMFTGAEFGAMKQYVQEGGAMLVTLGEGARPRLVPTSTTSPRSIACNSDAVVRTVYYKYLHPKEVHVSNGVLNREINVAAGKRPAPAQGASAAAIAESSRSNLAFAYPYGERRRCHSAPCSLMSTPSAVRRSPPHTCATDPGASSPRPCASCSLSPQARSMWRSRRTRCCRGTLLTRSTGRSARSGRPRRTAAARVRSSVGQAVRARLLVPLPRRLVRRRHTSGEAPSSCARGTLQRLTPCPRAPLPWWKRAGWTRTRTAS